jgi:uncharacterized metal-binding protein YceD (DUF177 family)
MSPGEKYGTDTLPWPTGNYDHVPEFQADTLWIHNVHGAGTQPCVASAEPVPFLVTERIALLLTQATPEGGEIELSSADLDVEPLEGDIVDLGEITAQAFALGLDPYPRSAVSVAGVISEDEAVALRSPFAVLKKS